MKPVLSINETEFAEVFKVNQRDRELVAGWSNVLIWYHQDWIQTGAYIAKNDIRPNVFYINELFLIVSYLHQYYEFSQRHFELLILAINNIERLYQKELQSNPEKALEMREQVISSLEKTVLIFQTASNATEDKQLALEYSVKAQEHIGKISRYLEEQQGESHVEVMQRLYQKYSQEPFIGPFLQDMEQKYQAKLAEEISRSTLSFSTTRSASSSFSSHGSSIPSSPQFFAPHPSVEAQPLLTHRHVGDITFDALDR